MESEALGHSWSTYNKGRTKSGLIKLGVVCTPVIPALGKGREWDLEFEVSLSCIAGPYLNYCFGAQFHTCQALSWVTSHRRTED
jgi:hypothetical protein